MSGDAVLEAVRLVRLLGREGFPAVRDVSLRVLPGRIHALLGPNGAGKSTTVRMCATLLRPTSGSVAVDGVDAVAHPERTRAPAPATTCSSSPTCRVCPTARGAAPSTGPSNASTWPTTAR